MLRRIGVTYTLAASEDFRTAIERVHSVHQRFCPVARSLEGAITITTEYRLRADEERHAHGN